MSRFGEYQITFIESSHRCDGLSELYLGAGKPCARVFLFSSRLSHWNFLIDNAILILFHF